MWPRLNKEMTDFNEYPKPFIHLISYNTNERGEIKAKEVIIGPSGPYENGRF